MTDNEIIKALECFLEKKPNNECNGCSFHETYYKEFTCCSLPTEEELIRNAIALINRQKEIIEQTQTNLRNRDFDMVVMQGTINRQKAEIERLKHFVDANEMLKAEAVKEFGEMVKEKIRTMSRIVVYDEDIDNLVKEFTEGG